MKNKTIVKLIYIFALLQPFLDLFTSLMVRFSSIPLTIGMVVRGLFLILMLFYLLKSNSIHKKKSLIYIGFITLFIILYFISKPNLLSLTYLKEEIKYIFKYFYFPIITLCMINLLDDKLIKKEKFCQAFIFNIIVYSLLIVVPELLGISFTSYTGSNLGSVGWFYAANEIGALCVILFSYLYYLIYRRFSCKLILPLFILTIISLVLLGTKTSFLGMLITEIIFFIYFIFNYKKNNGYGLKISIVLLITSIVVIPNIPVINNLKNSIRDANKIEESSEQTDITDRYITNEKLKKIIKVTFSGRDTFFFNTLNIYETSDISNKLLGIGFSNTPEINNKKIEKLIEIDFFDTLFHFGIIGAILIFFPLGYILVKAAIMILNRKQKIKFGFYSDIYVSLISTMISLIAGHVFGSPSVSIYIAISLAMIDNTLMYYSAYEVTKKRENKITIYALHLGYGGVEKYLSSLCKMLNQDYQITMVVTYKLLDKPAFEIPDNVKIVYLINRGPNKEELKNAIKNKSITGILKEGFRAVTLLIQKRERNIKYIRNDTSDYIITTRTFHNRLVGTYSNSKIIKIATEHNYHNNDKKYIKKVIKSINSFDYFCVVSPDLKEFYQDKIKDTKCIYIPNVIDEIPKYYEHKKSNKLISVGRLSPEKGFLDLINIISLVKKKNPNIKLDIYGEGSERLKIIEEIKRLHLTDNIKLCGFVKQEKIMAKMNEYAIYVMPSYTESFGLVLIEAMSQSLPCIAFNSANGAKNLLNNNQGILIEKRNNEEFSKAIIELISNDNLRNKTAKKGYESLNNYLARNVKKLWLELLEESKIRRN